MGGPEALDPDCAADHVAQAPPAPKRWLAATTPPPGDEPAGGIGADVLSLLPSSQPEAPGPPRAKRRRRTQAAIDDMTPLRSQDPLPQALASAAPQAAAAVSAAPASAAVPAASAAAVASATEPPGAAVAAALPAALATAVLPAAPTRRPPKAKAEAASAATTAGRKRGRPPAGACAKEEERESPGAASGEALVPAAWAGTRQGAPEAAAAAPAGRKRGRPAAGARAKEEREPAAAASGGASSKPAAAGGESQGAPEPVAAPAPERRRAAEAPGRVAPPRRVEAEQAAAAAAAEGVSDAWALCPVPLADAELGQGTAAAPHAVHGDAGEAAASAAAGEGGEAARPAGRGQKRRGGGCSTGRRGAPRRKSVKAEAPASQEEAQAPPADPSESNTPALVEEPGRPAGVAEARAGAGAFAAAGPPPRPPLPGAPCFSSTGLELSKRQKRTIREMGWALASDWVPGITHLVADTFRRTTKMMCAICCGAHIVTPGYLDACREAGGLVDEAAFILRDEVCEAAFARKRGIGGGYSLAVALERSRSGGKLLAGVSVYCFPSVAEKRELPMLVEAAGGTWLSRWPDSPDASSVLLLAERTVGSEKEQQRRRAHEVFDVELLREATCTQQLRRGAYRLR
ncbi:unnamed protein product [Prorocentrum cordatum]|uniref:BRCT domain-containing protein n=1 Tax=Prorocentrum cordatum TaxID=2364126 RepID=A0ABN9P8Y8_9DINO|nr:unnamed protein product [Polarella glacialis]